MDCTKFNGGFEFALATCIVNSVIGFLAAVLNGTVMITVLKDPLKKLRTPFNYLIFNLCFCDFLVASVVAPITAYAGYKEKNVVVFWMDLVAPDIIILAAIFSVGALSYDRYKAIINPIKYRVNMSWQRCVKYSMTIWILAILAAAPMKFIDHIPYAVIIHSNVITVGHALLMVFVYIRVKYALRAQNNEFKEKLSASLTNSQEAIGLRIKTEKNVVGVFNIILAVVLLFLIPGLIAFDLFAFVYRHECFFGFVTDNIRLFGFILNSLVNPLICIFKLRDFRKSI
eukprot:TCONS_00001704-protein